jgi:hypothetical protein
MDHKTGIAGPQPARPVPAPFGVVTRSALPAAAKPAMQERRDILPGNFARFLRLNNGHIQHHPLRPIQTAPLHETRLDQWPTS